MTTAAGAAEDAATQNRPSGAKWPRTISLRTRLALLVALAVALVIGIATVLELQTSEQALRRDLLDAAANTAMAVADDVDVRTQQPAADEIASTLHEFIEAVPAIRSITVVEVSDRGATVIASTSAEVRPQALTVALAAVAARRPVWNEQVPLLPMVAMPVAHGGRVFGAVTVTVSLAAVEQLRGRGRLRALLFAPVAMILLTLLVHLLARHLFHTPIRQIRETMHRAGRGDLTARAPVIRHDELGEVADGLNEMLGRMQDLTTGLQTRVDEATRKVRQRNEQIVDSYARVLDLREALARAAQMASVGQTATNVAHQIGTPLNLVSGYVQMLREELKADANVTRRLQIIEEQIAKVESVVRGLLDRARRPVTRERIDLRALVDRIADLARPRLEVGRIALELAIDAVPAIEGDEVALELALLNLVSNAIDAMPAGGTLHVDLSPGGAGPTLRVRDTGVGIAPDLLPRIFEPWVTTKDAGRGTGLGLSITRDVIASHGGRIGVVSAPGEGTTFTVDLPAAPGAAEA